MGKLSSYFKALKATRRFGVALKQDKKGETARALRNARDGLRILSLPGVIRSNPAESSVLIQLTLLVESLTHESGESGASEKDLCDTYLSITELEGTDVYSELSEWLLYIENKLGYVPSNN